MTSDTGKLTTPSSMMANTGATPTSSLGIHVNVQSQLPDKQEIVNPSLQTHPHDSIASLRSLSHSLLAFQRCYTELNQHIDSIRSTIHSVLPLLTTNTNTTPLPASSPPPTTVLPVPEPEPKSESKPEQSWESDPSEDDDDDDEEEEEEELQSPRGEELQSPHHEEAQSHHSEEVKFHHREEAQSHHSEEVKFHHSEEAQSHHNEEVKFHHREEVQRPLCSELQNICELANGRSLRRYMAKRISGMNRLLEEVPKALRLASNPARLVLECMGKFHEQNSKSLAKDFRMIQGRKASILILECFLMMGIDKSVYIHKRVKDEADKAALAWRNRFITKRNATRMDAQGLLLLIGCFGIPGGFTNEDIRNLLQKGPIKQMKGALRRSNVLMAKVPDSEESLKKMKENKDSLAAMDEAKRKHLFALISVSKCLKLHDIEASKLLPGWKIDEKIMALENEIGGFDKQTGRQMAQKRKNDGTGSSRRYRNREANHLRFSPWLRLRQQGVDDHVNINNTLDETASSRRSRNREAKRFRFSPCLRQQRVDDHVNINNTLVKGLTIGRCHGHTVSSPVLHGPAAGSIHENVAGSLAGTVRGVAMGGTGSGISASAAGTDVVQQGGSDAGGHGGTLVDSTAGQIGSHAGQFYGRRRDAAVYDRPASSNYAYRPSSYVAGSKGLQNSQLSAASMPPSLEGSVGLPNTPHSDAYRPPPYLEGSTGLPNTAHSNAYRPPPYLEGSSQLPNAIPGYFAGQSSASAHPSSYLYRPR
ncbi:hypothetical protein BC332_09268 [Capsicum chinense]|nr:hypothetical protein BC332_09268 [Capsicum chinense]